jgi:tRNA(fMet)-specific endonuclease VapC
VPLVIDTDVVSYLYKRDTRARLYEPHLNNPPFIISFMTLAELRRWTLERNWGAKRREELEEYLTRNLVLHSDVPHPTPTPSSIRDASLSSSLR